MLAIENKAGFGVVKTFGRGVPVQHVEIGAIVIGMTLDASRAGRSCTWKRGVQAAIVLQFRRDLSVALRAAIGWGARVELMALGALRFAAKTLVGFGERAR